MTPEKIIEEEMHKFGEYIEMLPDNQLASFMVPVLANRCHRAEMLASYYRKRLEKYEDKKVEKELEHGAD